MFCLNCTFTKCICKYHLYLTHSTSDRHSAVINIFSAPSGNLSRHGSIMQNPKERPPAVQERNPLSHSKRLGACLAPSNVYKPLEKHLNCLQKSAPSPTFFFSRSLVHSFLSTSISITLFHSLATPPFAVPTIPAGLSGEEKQTAVRVRLADEFLMTLKGRGADSRSLPGKRGGLLQEVCACMKTSTETTLRLCVPAARYTVNLILQSDKQAGYVGNSFAYYTSLCAVFPIEFQVTLGVQKF